MNRFQTIDYLEGRGKIEAGGEPVCDAKYNIRVDQEMVDASSMSGRDEIPGLKRISGSIHPVEEHAIQRLFGKDNLTLVMKDGRKLDFFFRDSSGSIANRSGIYESSASSD